jgi:Zn-dependent membrane protease YugP
MDVAFQASKRKNLLLDGADLPRSREEGKAAWLVLTAAVLTQGTSFSKPRLQLIDAE